MKVFDKVFLKVQDKVANKDLNYKHGLTTVITLPGDEAVNPDDSDMLNPDSSQAYNPA